MLPLSREREYLLDWGYSSVDVLRPRSLGELVSPDERIPDAHAWLLMTINAMSSNESRITSSFAVRLGYIPRYGFVIPRKLGLEAIKQLSPNGLIDFGCGNGYLSFLLRSHGVDVLAVDNAPPAAGQNNYWDDFGREKEFLSIREGFFQHTKDIHITDEMKTSLRRHWTPITHGSYETIAEASSDRTLLISWPPHDDPMAFNALRSYQGRTLIYIGERWPGCTASQDFFDEIMRGKWTNVPVPRESSTSFSGVHDRMYVFVR